MRDTAPDLPHGRQKSARENDRVWLDGSGRLRNSTKIATQFSGLGQCSPNAPAAGPPHTRGPNVFREPTFNGQWGMLEPCGDASRIALPDRRRPGQRRVIRSRCARVHVQCVTAINAGAVRWPDRRRHGCRRRAPMDGFTACPAMHSPCVESRVRRDRPESGCRSRGPSASPRR